jgi:hypothetical protein
MRTSTTSKRLDQRVDILNEYSRVRFPGWMKVTLDSEMKLLSATLEPNATSPC